MSLWCAATQNRVDRVNSRGGSRVCREPFVDTRGVTYILALKGKEVVMTRLLRSVGFVSVVLALSAVAAAQGAPAGDGQAMVSKANAAKSAASALAGRITAMLDQARKEKDIMRANCLNRKLTEVN